MSEGSFATTEVGQRGATIRAAGRRWDIPVGEPTDAGRAATIALGTDDPFLHGVVWRITPWDDHWSIEVPLTSKLEVHVVVGRIRRFVGAAGDRWTSNAPAAEIVVTTVERRHGATVAWWRSAPIDPDDEGYVAPAASTVDLVTGLDLMLARHRAIVVACADRLADRYQPGAASNEATAARLGLTVAAVKRRIDRAVQDVKGWWSAGDVPIDEGRAFFDRHAAVDWLVATGQVTRATVDQALAVERSAGP